MYTKESLKKLVSTLHDAVYGSIVDRFDEPSRYDGYYEDATAIYLKLVNDMYNEKG